MALSKIDSNFVKIVLTTAFKTKVGLEVIRGFELNEIFKFVLKLYALTLFFLKKMLLRRRCQIC